MPRRASPEHTLQCAIVQHLMLRGAPGTVWFHCPNGEYRSKRTGAKLKAMGVRPGVPDLICIVNGRTYGLELKAGRGRQSAAQRAMEDAWTAAGGVYAMADNLDDALSWLESWRMLRGSRKAIAAADSEAA